ncbi:uncharacterized protein K441DRAFT_561656 [Cenococcum geophilum 1.58]|uniref:uncharacterized protein n=1 Tax=Cenococcum geophilum 1.58 TaxID=794803 RepID=UPI00358F97B6|nr:hypothetical protein K441DRAFT_561656 [Cenococcum geophilum 1.58]
MRSSTTNPRQRLSLYTNSTLGHDVSAAFKASAPSSISSRSTTIEETPAPPPSPVDFGFATTPAEQRSDAWHVRTASKEGVVAL